jgi:hypothetical protein
MAAIRRAFPCAWVASRGGPCATPAAYTVRLLTAAGAPLMVGACAAHLGPLIKRSLTHPTIVQASVELEEFAEPTSQQPHPGDELRSGVLSTGRAFRYPQALPSRGYDERLNTR